MPMIKRFEDIRAWATARELVNSIYEISKEKPFSNDFALRDQLRRASISVMSNIVEGFDSGYRPEFVRFLRLAFRSASEIQSQLYTALDQSYIDQGRFETVYENATTVKKQINSFITYLEKKRSNGFPKSRIAEVKAGYQTESNDLEWEYEIPVDLHANSQFLN
jgi:four helix bundle protein